MKYLTLLIVLLIGCRSSTLEESGSQSEAEAIATKAGYHFSGTHGYEKDWDKAKELLLEIEEERIPKAVHLQGVIAYYNFEWENALNYLEKAIALGHSSSYIIASNLYFSSPCTREKASKAFEYLEKAVEHEIEPAERMLATHIAGLKHVHEIGNLTEATQACYDEAESRNYF